jgi:hypothetical protein
MIRSTWVILLVASAGLARGQEPWPPAASGAPAGSVVIYREFGAPPRKCAVLQGSAAPDGARVYLLQALEHGEAMTVAEGGPAPAFPGAPERGQILPAGTAWQPRPVFPPGAVFLFLQNGQPPRPCEVIKGWALPGGACVYQVWALTPGEVLLVRENPSPSAAPGEIRGERFTPAFPAQAPPAEAAGAGAAPAVSTAGGWAPGDPSSDPPETPPVEETSAGPGDGPALAADTAALAPPDGDARQLAAPPPAVRLPALLPLPAAQRRGPTSAPGLLRCGGEGANRGEPETAPRPARLHAQTAPSTAQAPEAGGDDNPGTPFPGAREWVVEDDGEACVEEAGPCCDGACAAPGHVWVRGEYLLWWTKSSPLPPLVTTSLPGTPVGSAGILGAFGTSVLFGGQAVSENPRSGGRISAGGWLNDSQCLGLEGYFFGLQGVSNHFDALSTGNPILARPFFNVQTGAPDATLIAFPGVVKGGVNVALSSTDLVGAGADLRANVCCGCSGLCCGCCYRVDLLGGYRFLHMHEGFGLSETEIAAGPNAPAPAGTRIDLSDSFGTENQFHGAEVGVNAEFRHCRWSVDVLGKLAVGETAEDIAINGNTSIKGGPPAPGGFLALPTNSGNFHRSPFAFVPEVGLDVGYQLTEHLRVFAGYTFIYWSKVARPGDQIDLALNPSQFPPGHLRGLPRPAFIPHDTDFWLQGIDFGGELRF